MTSFQTQSALLSRFKWAQTSAWVVLVTAILLGGPGCSKLKPDNTNATSSGGHTNTSTSNANTVAAPAPPSEPGRPTPWEANADSLNATNGQPLALACPPGGTPHSVWGSGIYTSDSSVCTAAVHSGLITYEKGGTVTITMRPGRNLYGCSERNGVTSSPYGSWQHSFVFKTDNTEAFVAEADEATEVMWNTSATTFGSQAEKTLKFKCPAGGKESNVWGTDIYTLDSSICTAAVHAGKLKMETGGPVTIEVRPGEPSYKGSTRNGVKSNDYEAYGSSFTVK